MTKGESASDAANRGERQNVLGSGHSRGHSRAPRAQTNCARVRAFGSRESAGRREWVLLMPGLRQSGGARGSGSREHFKENDLGGTRTLNPQIRSLIRYPLRHEVLLRRLCELMN